jgi:multiphosphoryl transfer protein
MVDAAHPGVLRLVALACAGARVHNRPIGVCGGLAADVSAAIMLIGLGVTELSVQPARIGALKARLRTVTLADCQQLATKALACATAPEVRALVAGCV